MEVITAAFVALGIILPGEEVEPRDLAHAKHELRPSDTWDSLAIRLAPTYGIDPGRIHRAT